MLEQLVRHAGEPVSKEHFFATVWNGTAVSDDALTSCIQEPRRALDDDPRQPRFIETRHRRGNRFIARLSVTTSTDGHEDRTLLQDGDRPPEQEIRFCHTSDGVSLAYSVIGTGPCIVGVLGHFTHLEEEWR